MGFSKTSARNHPDCRDHAGAAVRVQFIAGDERCAIYAFDGKIGCLLSYEISLSYAAPLELIRAAIIAAVDPRRPQAVEDAARALLEARADEMVTQEEWDRLAAAVDAASAAKAGR